jgi:hypothetical protein
MHNNITASNTVVPHSSVVFFEMFGKDVRLTQDEVMTIESAPCVHNKRLPCPAGTRRFQPSADQIFDWARRCSEGEYGLTVGPIGEALAAGYAPLKRARTAALAFPYSPSVARIETFEAVLDQAQALYPENDRARALDMEDALTDALHARAHRGEMEPLQAVARAYPELRGLVLLALSFPRLSLYLAPDDFD